MLTAPKHTGWRAKAFEVIFEADTPAGKFFDLALIAAIFLSVLVVMLDSVASIHVRFGVFLRAAEWFFTILFTVEYITRLSCVGRPRKYATSFFGVVDLLAVLPTYVSLIIPGTQYLLVVRVLRTLRIFRILKLGEMMRETSVLRRALYASRRKIFIFFFAVMTLVVIMGSMMYLIEGPASGFNNIPRSIYWAIVTLTTVGYGDISPQTGLGRAFASVVMLLGYSIIAVPSGIITGQIMSESRKGHAISTQACPRCSSEGHDADAAHCKFCGARL